MSKDYSNVLKKIVLNYITQSQSKNIFFADSEFKYNQSQFSSKVFRFKTELDRNWNNKNKGREVEFY